jgi:hypothetical protein
MDYMLTSEGQAAVNKTDGIAVVKGVVGAVDRPLRVQDIKALSPANVTAYGEYWNALFKK